MQWRVFIHKLVEMFKAVTVVISVAILTLVWKKRRYFDQDIIQGRNVVITGASSGIGEELAYCYAKLGANVLITARRENLLKEVVAKCRSLNPRGRFGYYVADMAMYKTESKTLIQKAVQLMNGIDTLVLNHANFGHLVVWHGTDEELAMFEKMSAINFNSYVYIASHALPYLKSAGGGRLGITSSTAGKLPYVTAATYASSKFALDGFFSTLREELSQAKSNVTVTLVVLGSISTKGVADFFEVEKKRLPMKRQDIVDMAEDFIETPMDAAHKVMEATETGVEELYYPHWFQSLKMSMPSSYIAIVRHMWPSLIESFVLSEEFYKNQEPVNKM